MPDDKHDEVQACFGQDETEDKQDLRASIINVDVKEKKKTKKSSKRREVAAVSLMPAKPLEQVVKCLN